MMGLVLILSLSWKEFLTNENQNEGNEKAAV
jgi:hypothetical protein